MRDMVRDFYEYSYFGAVFDHSKDLADVEIQIVSMRAYRDFNRTLRYREGTDKPCQDGKTPRWHFVSDISKDQLIPGVCSLLSCQNVEEYNDKHRQCCIMILNAANDPQYEQLLEEKFTYGQVQKWVNMTMKYLFILGYVPESVQEFLHVPIDDYILKSVWYTNHRQSELQELVCDRKKLPFAEYDGKSYASSGIPKWSKWLSDGENGQCSAYDHFQSGIRQALEGSGLSPINWEARVWLVMSQNEKQLK